VSALIHFVDVHVLSNWEEAGNHTLAMKYANCTTSLALSTLKPGIHHSKHTYSLYMSNSICNCQWSMKHCRDFVSEFVHFWPETNTSDCGRNWLPAHDQVTIDEISEPRNLLANTI